VDDDLNEWFIRNILAHESGLVRFFSRVWPDRSEVQDLCHETYLRIYESAQRSRPTSPRGFLFATARHLVLDRLRHGKVVSIELQGDLAFLNVLIDDLSPERWVGARQELWQLARAFQALPPKYKEIMWMVRVEERTQNDIAERLKLTRKAVERRLAYGMRLLQEIYLNNGFLCPLQEDDTDGEQEITDHG